MATTYLSGKNVKLTLKPFGTGEHKRLVCDQDLELSGDAEVTEVKTKSCGTAIDVDTPSYTITSSGVANVTPGATEISHNDMLGWFDGGQKLDFIIENEDDGVTNEGEGVYREGAAYVSSYQETYNNGEKVLFNFTLRVDGTLDREDS